LYPTFVVNLTVCFHEPVQMSSKGVIIFIFAEGLLSSCDIKKMEEALV
jgi:hypothetical protein